MEFVSPIPHKKARIEIIPLIDIMFFLLASFMMVSLSQVHMKGIKVNLPTGFTGETRPRRNTSASRWIRTGRFISTRRRSSPTRFIDDWSRFTKTSPNAKIFIRGDRDAYHGDIIRLIEQVRAAGIYKIAFEIKSASLPYQHRAP